MRGIERVSGAGSPRGTSLRTRLGGWTWVYLVLTVGSSVSAIAEPGAQTWQRVLVAAFLPAVVWGVLVRRDRPLALPLLAVAMAATCTDAVLPVAMFSLALRRRDRIAALLAALAVIVVVVVFRLDLIESTMGAGLTFEGQRLPGQLEVPLQMAADLAILIGLPLLLGAFLGQRRALLASLEDRARRAEEDRERRAEQAVADERQRLAGEMHDVVGHKLALISMQAGVLEVNPGAAADVVATQATAVRVAASQAQAELRALLDVLQEQVAPRAPQPGLDEVPALVAGAQAAGAEVRLVVDVEGEPVPAVGRAAHRIVREGLTNALGHAPGQPVTVTLSGDGRGGVAVEVANPLPAPPDVPRGTDRTGTGLASLAERARVVGGTLTAGPAADHWLLRAVLPDPGAERGTDT